MSARTGSLIFVLVLVFGGLFYWLAGDGAEREGGRAPERLGVDVPTAAADLRAADGSDGVVPSESSENAGAGARSVVASNEEREADLPPAKANEADRSKVAILSGYVQNDLGRPIVGARVLATRSAMELMMADTISAFGEMDEDSGARVQEALTDERGFFELVGVSPGQPALEITASGYVPLTKVDLSVAARAHQSLARPIVLDASAVVTGVVLDPNGAPVVGAKVTTKKKKAGIMGMALAAMTGEGVKTLEDGSFRLDELEPAELEVVVTHPGFLLATADVDAREAGPIAELTLRLERGATLRGRITGMPPDAASQLQVVAIPDDFNPIQGLEIRTAGIARDGSFELFGLSKGSKWNVFAREDDGEEPSMMTMWIDEGTATNRVEATAEEHGVELEYRDPLTITFQVVDAVSKRPISRLKVSAKSVMFGGGPAVEHYPEGRVRLEGLWPDTEGEVTVNVDADGYQANVRLVERSRGPEVDLGTVELVGAEVARFRTIDAETGLPLEDVEVRVLTPSRSDPDSAAAIDAFVEENDLPTAFAKYSEQHSATSDVDGLARVETALAGGRTVSATATGYAPLRLTEVELTGADVEPITLALHRGATVRVVAEDFAGFRLGARTIEHRDGGAEREDSWFDDESSLVTDAEGVAIFEHLAPGEHAFRIAELESVDEEPNMMMFMMAASREGDEDEETWTSLEIVGQESRELELVEIPKGSLQGRVMEDGKPLKRATLTMRRADSERTTPEEGSDPVEAAFLSLGDRMTGGGGPSAKTQRDGLFEFESLDVGRYVLAIDHPKRAMPTEFDVTIVPGDQILDFDLELAILAGEVVDANGDGVKGARVSVTPFVDSSERKPEDAASDALLASGLMSELLGVEGQARTITTKFSGSFELRGVTPGIPLVVHVDGSAAGFQNHTAEPVELGRNETREDLRIVLRRGGTLDVTVLDADGSAAEFVLVRLERPDGKMEPRNELAMGGVKQLTGLEPGTYRVVADDDPDEDALFGGGDPSMLGKAEATVEIVEGATVSIELRLP